MKYFDIDSIKYLDINVRREWYLGRKEESQIWVEECEVKDDGARLGVDPVCCLHHRDVGKRLPSGEKSVRFGPVKLG